MYCELFNTRHVLITFDTIGLKLGLELCLNSKARRFVINLLVISICIN